MIHMIRYCVMILYGILIHSYVQYEEISYIISPRRKKKPDFC